MIVEPVQGVGGAFDLGAEFLTALRKRCDETGAVLIFDEVQCGFGRSGEPFAANLYGVLPDMITSAKALGDGFPCAALLMMEKAADAVKMDALGTTFGGGPMACAAIEAAIDAIETEDLLANVRRVAAYIRKTCIVGPVTGHQGAGFLTGLITQGAGEGRAEGAARAATSSPAPAAIRTCCACCRPSSSRRPRSTCSPPRSSGWADAPLTTTMKRFIDLADLDTVAVRDLVGLAARLEQSPRPAGAGRQGAGPAVHEPVAAHAGLVPGRHGAARRQLVRHHARRRHLAAGDPPRRRDERRHGRAHPRRHSGAGLLLPTRSASARSPRA